MGISGIAKQRKWRDSAILGYSWFITFGNLAGDFIQVRKRSGKAFHIHIKETTKVLGDKVKHIINTSMASIIKRWWPGYTCQLICS